MSESSFMEQHQHELPSTHLRCPACQDEGIASEVVLVENGYYASPVTWNDFIGDWVADPYRRAQSWSGTESYYQCDECCWQGGDPLGIEGPEES